VAEILAGTGHIERPAAMSELAGNLVYIDDENAEMAEMAEMAEKQCADWFAVWLEHVTYDDKPLTQEEKDFSLKTGRLPPGAMYPRAMNQVEKGGFIPQWKDLWMIPAFDVTISIARTIATGAEDFYRSRRERIVRDNGVYLLPLLPTHPSGLDMYDFTKIYPGSIRK